VQQTNHKIINNTFADPTAPYKVDDHINITNCDNLLIDNNIFLLGNYDLAIEGVGYITNSQISGNTIYVSSTGYAGMGGYWDGSTRNFGGFVMAGTKIINNKFNGVPWYYFTTTTGNYRNSVDSDAQAALGNNNTFAGNTAF
jgi:myosin-crossreactive antigen